MRSTVRICLGVALLSGLCWGVSRGQTTSPTKKDCSIHISQKAVKTGQVSMIRAALRDGTTNMGRGLPGRPIRFQASFNSGQTWYDLGFHITEADGQLWVPVKV